MPTQYYILVHCQGLFVHFKNHKGQRYGNVCIENSKQSVHAEANYYTQRFILTMVQQHLT